MLIGNVAIGQSLSPMEELGKSIYFDDNLSINGNQACSGCHDPAVGFTGPIEAFNAAGAVYEGSIAGRFGNRKPPSAAYATTSPILGFELEHNEAVFEGGNFWDGRATGEKLGNPSADQAQGPFLNPLEQGLPDEACVVYRVCNPAAGYPVVFEDVWGTGACAIGWPADIDAVCSDEEGMVTLSDGDWAKVDDAYDNVALSIAAFEGSPEVNQFSSKYDAYLAGMADLTKQEKKGLHLFKGKAKCANCHILDSDDDEPPLFTDYTFDNLGVPRNPDNPFYDELDFNPLGDAWIDLGLGGFLDTRAEWADLAEENLGKQKVPTLRNVDMRPYPEFVKAYAHNGYFKTLEGIVHFYNTRDAKPRCEIPWLTEAEALVQDCWPAPEVPENVNTTELGNLHLTDAQEDALVAFLKTLSDGYSP